MSRSNDYYQIRPKKKKKKKKTHMLKYKLLKEPTEELK